MRWKGDGFVGLSLERWAKLWNLLGLRDVAFAPVHG